MSDEAERERARYEALSTLVDNYRRERDDAREQLYLTKAELGRWVDRETKAARERDEARASVADAYRRGAEAMCMSVMQYLVRQQREATVMVVDTAIKGVHKLPIPEEP